MKEPKTFEEGVDVVLSELREIMLKKQADYGHENITDFGEMGVVVRMNDKMSRIKNLLKTGNDPKVEPLVDSFVDIANYSIIWLMLHKGVFKLPLSEQRKKNPSYSK